MQSVQEPRGAPAATTFLWIFGLTAAGLVVVAFALMVDANPRVARHSVLAFGALGQLALRRFRKR